MPTLAKRAKSVQSIYGAMRNQSDWLTPKYIIDALGPFDTDPCSSHNRTWDTAKICYTKKDNGLTKPWPGFVWLNPPYGRETGIWMEKLSKHGNGIALVFIRSETKWFQDYCCSASCMLLLSKRIAFIDGTTGEANGSASAPSVLIGFGPVAEQRIRESPLLGILVKPYA